MTHIKISRIVLNMAMRQAREFPEALTPEQCAAIELAARYIMRLERLMQKAA